MNAIHHWFCRSNSWRDTARKRVPWAIQDVALGPDVLEIGPGFGVTTDLLLPAVKRLTCVEVDRRLARKLAVRMFGKHVSVLCENAAALSLPDCSFDAVLCFTMLITCLHRSFRTSFSGKRRACCGPAEFSPERTAYIAGGSTYSTYSTRWW